jgi:hypothetical protein
MIKVALTGMYGRSLRPIPESDEAGGGEMVLSNNFNPNH